MTFVASCQMTARFGSEITSRGRENLRMEHERFHFRLLNFLSQNPALCFALAQPGAEASFHGSFMTCGIFPQFTKARTAGILLAEVQTSMACCTFERSMLYIVSFPRITSADIEAFCRWRVSVSIGASVSLCGCRQTLIKKSKRPSQPLRLELGLPQSQCWLRLL